MLAELFIGVDPGVKGAVAAMDRDRVVHFCEDFPIIKLAKTPVRRLVKNKATGVEELKTIRGFKSEFDFLKLAKMFADIAAAATRKIAMVEQVSSMPKQGVAGVFTFGGSYWAVRMALADHAISTELVPPKQWQKAAALGVFKDPKTRKKAYLAKARAMFPDTDLSLAKHTERAAALLIADYCRRSFLGGVL